MQLCCVCSKYINVCVCVCLCARGKTGSEQATSNNPWAICNAKLKYPSAKHTHLCIRPLKVKPGLCHVVKTAWGANSLLQLKGLHSTLHIPAIGVMVSYCVTSVRLMIRWKSGKSTMTVSICAAQVSKQESGEVGHVCGWVGIGLTW